MLLAASVIPHSSAPPQPDHPRRRNPTIRIGVHFDVVLAADRITGVVTCDPMASNRRRPSSLPLCFSNSRAAPSLTSPSDRVIFKLPDHFPLTLVSGAATSASAPSSRTQRIVLAVSVLPSLDGGPRKKFRRIQKPGTYGRPARRLLDVDAMPRPVIVRTIYVGMLVSCEMFQWQRSLYARDEYANAPRRPFARCRRATSAFVGEGFVARQRTLSSCHLHRGTGRRPGAPT
jgi:hypothetical protein